MPVGFMDADAFKTGATEMSERRKALRTTDEDVRTAPDGAAFEAASKRRNELAADMATYQAKHTGVINHYNDLISENNNVSKPLAAARAVAHGVMQAGRFTADQVQYLTKLAAANPKVAATIIVAGGGTGSLGLYELGKHNQQTDINREVAEAQGQPQG